MRQGSLRADRATGLIGTEETVFAVGAKHASLGHDYKRNGTTTLFAAPNVLDGTVTGRNMQRHRHQEFIRFLNALERDVPTGKVVHVILDNCAAHKHEKVRA